MQRRLLVMLLVSWPIAGLACNSDSDCKQGSNCLKASASVAGICLEGISPTNQGAKDPGDTPQDPSGANGKTCTFDTDCGSGSRCVKNSTFEGACMFGH
jgi:hypothetical protein